MNIPVICEDDYFLVVDKPAGLAVNRSENEKGVTLQDFIEDKFSIFNFQFSKEGDFYKRSGVVHRLDKDTSGLLIIAKKEDIFPKLQELFAKKEVVKKYYALVHGSLTNEGKINLPVGRVPWKRRKFGVLPGGREAITLYKLLKLYKSPSDESLSLLEVTPTTGRTHQIRIHFKSVGHPLVGDRLYAGKKVYGEDLKFCPRLFLQAYYLSFRHPVSESMMEIKIDLAPELQGVLEKLRL